MRCFIAIEIDEKVKNDIHALIEQLKATGADIRWVKSEGLHITLKFLGEIKEELVNSIQDILKKICMKHHEFTLILKGTGVFPDYSRPRVLWVGIEGNKEIEKLYKEIEEAMQNLGFQRETRKFSPHLTIGRVKSFRGIKEVLKDLRRYREHEFGKIDIKGVSLIKSTLKPSGAVYDTLFSAPLKGRRDE